MSEVWATLSLKCNTVEQAQAAKVMIEMFNEIKGIELKDGYTVTMNEDGTWQVRTRVRVNHDQP